MQSLQEQAQCLLKNEFLKFHDKDKFNIPFPMGVFGTLRQSGGNHRLMHKNGKYSSVIRAYLPHFIADGLTLYHNENSTAPFEIYFYDQNEWQKMIPSVDSLEGFNPKRETNHHGYHRTLAWLHIIPDSSEHIKSILFEKYSKRDLGIPKENWANDISIPCWIYSNMVANRKAEKMDYNPIIWY